MKIEEAYRILDLDTNATEDEVKKAFRAKAKKWHPDHNPSSKEHAEKKFRLVKEAYDTIKDNGFTYHKKKFRDPIMEQVFAEFKRKIKDEAPVKNIDFQLLVKQVEKLEDKVSKLIEAKKKADIVINKLIRKVKENNE